MKKRLLLLAALAPACAHKPRAPREASPEATEAVRERAAADLGCPAASVEVTVVTVGNRWRPWTFSAAGCNQHATYLSRAGTIIRN